MKFTGSIEEAKKKYIGKIVIIPVITEDGSKKPMVMGIVNDVNEYGLVIKPTDNILNIDGLEYVTCSKCQSVKDNSD